jgi:hypothetical protein
MKANHNNDAIDYKNADVVANISCSKNESKSQQGGLTPEQEQGCCKYQLFKE